MGKSENGLKCVWISGRQGEEYLLDIDFPNWRVWQWLSATFVDCLGYHKSANTQNSKISSNNKWEVNAFSSFLQIWNWNCSFTNLHTKEIQAIYNIFWNIMKHQQVIVDYTTMLKSSGTCLCLIFSGWILLRYWHIVFSTNTNPKIIIPHFRLLQAIFWLPGYMQSNQEKLYSQLEPTKKSPLSSRANSASGSGSDEEVQTQTVEAIEEESETSDQDKKDK